MQIVKNTVILGHRIAFKTWHGRFLRGDPDKNTLNAFINFKQLPWEIFEFFQNDNGTVSLITSQHKYVSAHDNGTITVDAKEKGDNEKFEFWMENHHCAFKTCYGTWIHAEPDGKCDCSAKLRKDYETFRYYIIPNIPSLNNYWEE